MQFLVLYGNQILYTILTGIITAVGAWIGKKYQKNCQEKQKRDTVKTCVRAVEQLYPEMLGPEKYAKAVESIKEILANKSIVITDLEIKMLIEEQCNEFNQQSPKYQGKHIE